VRGGRGRWRASDRLSSCRCDWGLTLILCLFFLRVHPHLGKILGSGSLLGLLEHLFPCVRVDLHKSASDSGPLICKALAALIHHSLGEAQSLLLLLPSSNFLSAFFARVNTQNYFVIIGPRPHQRRQGSRTRRRRGGRSGKGAWMGPCERPAQ